MTNTNRALAERILKLLNEHFHGHRDLSFDELAGDARSLAEAVLSADNPASVKLSSTARVWPPYALTASARDALEPMDQRPHGYYLERYDDGAWIGPFPDVPALADFFDLTEYPDFGSIYTWDGTTIGAVPSLNPDDLVRSVDAGLALAALRDIRDRISTGDFDRNGVADELSQWIEALASERPAESGYEDLGQRALHAGLTDAEHAAAARLAENVNSAEPGVYVKGDERMVVTPEGQIGNNEGTFAQFPTVDKAVTYLTNVGYRHVPDYIWRDPHSDGWIDAWNGWYETLEQALVEAAAGVGTPWVLAHGQGLILARGQELISQDEPSADGEARPRPRKGTNVYKMLDASTSHLPGTLRFELNEQPGIIVDRRQYGWLLFVPDDIDETCESVLIDTAEARGIEDESEIDPEIDGIPQPIIDLWLCARAHDCQYVLLDADGPVLSGLNTYS